LFRNESNHEIVFGVCHESNQKAAKVKSTLCQTENVISIIKSAVYWKTDWIGVLESQLSVKFFGYYLSAFGKNFSNSS